MTEEKVNVKGDCGAVGDGRTDDTEAFQRAVDEAGKTGATVGIPEGTYRVRGIRIDRPVNIVMEGNTFTEN